MFSFTDYYMQNFEASPGIVFTYIQFQSETTAPKRKWLK